MYLDYSADHLSPESGGAWQKKRCDSRKGNNVLQSCRCVTEDICVCLRYYILEEKCRHTYTEFTNLCVRETEANSRFDFKLSFFWKILKGSSQLLKLAHVYGWCCIWTKL